MRVAAVSGLAAEARLLERRGIRVIATGGLPQRVDAAAARLLSEGAEGLVSFGIAGALMPGLAAGTLLLPRRVVTEPGAAFAIDEAWRARVVARLSVSATNGDMVGRDMICGLPAEKAALHRATAAIAVDLESHRVGAVAARAGVPFLVLRAVADPADFALPAAAAVGLDEEGRAAPFKVLAALLRAPGQLGAVIAIAGHTRRALGTLARVLDALDGGGRA